MPGGELGGGAACVGGRERALHRLEPGRVRAHERRQLAAHAPLLGLLVLGGEQEAVVQLDGEERLHEDGLARGGAVLHHAGEAARRGGADGDDEAAVPHRDVLLAYDAVHVGIAHHAEEACLHLSA